MNTQGNVSSVTGADAPSAHLFGVQPPEAGQSQSGSEIPSAEAPRFAHTDSEQSGITRRTMPLREIRQLADREAITAALRETNGQVPAAAAALRISRAQLYRLIGRLKIRGSSGISAAQ